MLCGAPTHTTLPVVEALVRWDPAWFAGRELADRAALHLPPTVALAAVTGERRAVRATVDQADLARFGLQDVVEQLGPLSVGEDEARVLLRAPLEAAPALAEALADVRASRSARKEAAGVQLRMDPPDLAG